MQKKWEEKNKIPYCVILFAKEDVVVAQEVVTALRGANFKVWWSEDITHGEWDTQVREQIQKCDAVVPVVTANTLSKSVFADEWRYAHTVGRPIFPFVLDASGVPFGMGQFNRTEASAWAGDPSATPFLQLKTKLCKNSGLENCALGRPRQLFARNKILPLPAFVFSLSSFETQLHPVDGLVLLHGLSPASCLVSAYDVHAEVHRYREPISRLCDSDCVMFLDSGNYEATRTKSHWKPKRPDGWRASKFWETAAAFPWDIVFSYDDPPPKGTASEVVDSVLDAYFKDMIETGLEAGTLCPIVHVPDSTTDLRKDAATIVFEVAREIRPALIAIPERELGDGVLERMRTVKAIRAQLSALEFYQPLHILGTGNPVTMAALSVCGADTFDGLEWCRTAANFETNSLMHFQQFDLLVDFFSSRMTNSEARGIVELLDAPFAARVASFNFDYFTSWTGYLQHSVHTSEPQLLFSAIPYLGNALSKEYLR